MDGAATSLGPTHMARLLGPWRVVEGGEHPGAGRTPVRQALADRVKSLILDGRLPVGTRLPAERQLCETLQVSRTTVTAAYASLVEQGYASARRGSGTFTALPARLSARGGGGWRPDDDDDLVDLTCAAPAAPLTQLRAATLWAAERMHSATTKAFQPYGLPVLREAIAERYTARGLPTAPDQILVTSGAQGAITLVARLLVRAGDRVVVEGPSYANALETFETSKARLTPVPLEESGWLEASTGRMAMAEATRRVAPRLVYSIPHFHNPTGLLMPPEQAGPLARAARQAGAWLLADETVTDMAIDVPVPPPFATGVGPADAERLLVCGSLGKSFWGGLRIGWLRAPSRVVHELAASRASLDLSSPLLDQLIAKAVLSEGFAVPEDRRPELRVARDALEAELRATMPDWTWHTPEGGFCLWVRLAEGEESTPLVYRAGTHGLLLQSGPRFGADPGTYERFLRLPYTQTPEMLAEAVRRLAAARVGYGPHHAPTSRVDLVA